MTSPERLPAPPALVERLQEIDDVRDAADLVEGYLRVRAESAGLVRRSR